MPDLVSHICSGVVFGSRLRTSGALAVFCFGVILPDIFTRPLYILWPRTYWFVHPLHAPAGIVFLCLLFSGFFVVSERRRVFWILLSGSFLHLLLDLTQTQSHAYPLAFPLSWKGVHTGMIHPDHTLYLLPVWVVLAATVLVRRRRRRGADKAAH